MEKISDKYFKYAILALPISFAGLPIYIHIPYFYSKQYDINLVHLSLIIIIIRLFDAFQDPLIGYLSDKYNIHRKSILAFGGFMLIISVFGLFNKPLFFDANIWLIIFLFFATSAYSVMAINYNTLGALCSNDKFERTKITSQREICGIIGLVLASSIPSILQNYFNLIISFKYFSWIFILLSLICYLIFFDWYGSKNIVEIDNYSKSKFNKILIFNTLKDKKIFYIMFFVSTFASSIPSILVLFFIDNVLKLSDYSGLFLALYFLSGAVCMHIWKIMSYKIGKIDSWICAMILSVLTFIWAFLIQEGQLIAYSVICILSGAVLGADLSLPPSILADLTDNHKENITTNFSILTFLMKLSLALSSGALLYLLSLNSFVPGEENSNHIIYWLSFYYAIIPCIIKILAILIGLYWRRLNVQN